jgi:hypothetical protein
MVHECATCLVWTHALRRLHGASNEAATVALVVIVPPGVLHPTNPMHIANKACMMVHDIIPIGPFLCVVLHGVNRWWCSCHSTLKKVDLLRRLPRCT